MNKAKLTPIFPAHIKPVHVGAYLVKGYSSWYYSNWDGRFWGLLATNAKDAYEVLDGHGFTQEKSWCGLAVKP